MGDKMFENEELEIINEIKTSLESIEEKMDSLDSIAESLKIISEYILNHGFR